MKIEVIQEYSSLYLLLTYNNRKYSTDIEMINILELSDEEYENILIKCGGHKKERGGLYFNIKEDAEKCIEALDPYLIMAKLIE